MKIAQFSAYGEPHEVVECIEAPDPGDPDADEVVVEVEAFPINPVDLLTIAGKYAARPDLPATPGSEGIGRVVAVGAGVERVAVGDRVMLVGRENWSQQKRIKADMVLKLPDSGDPHQFAMAKINPATALLMLRNYVDLSPGDWVMQDAANSGVGNNLIRLAKANGIRTVNVVRREALIEPLKAIGADVVVVDGDDLAARVAAETEGADIRLAIDAIGGDICLRLADCLGNGAMIVNYGMLSGEACRISPDHLVFKGIIMAGFWFGGILPFLSVDEREDLFADIVPHIADGTLHVPVEATYGIGDIKAALEHAGRTSRDGKILVIPNAE
jgi:mitochondrial enoyl-[acyl-carrier protein] reductase / trans-2-enoyl-CoA reductase